MHAAPAEGRSRARALGLRVAGERAITWIAPVVLLVLVWWWWLTLAIQGSPGDWAFDFRQFWQGAHDVVAGLSPYPSSDLLASAGPHLDPDGIRDVFRFPYPAGAAILLAPLGLLGFHTAAAVWSAMLVLSLLSALWLLGVRDWRVLGVVVSSVPVISSVRLGTLTPILLLLLAVTWRWRDRRWVAGISLALAVSLKLFLWPLVVWLVVTRRHAAAIIALCASVAATFAAWAAIGFAGLSTYPELLRRLTDVVADRGYSLVGLGAAAGVPEPVTEALPWLFGLALLVGAVYVRHQPDGDRVSFSLSVAAAIVITPIVWLHYFALLIAPLALARPRMSWAWALLWVFWLTPSQENQGDLWRIVLVVAVVGASVVMTTRHRLLLRGGSGG